MTADEVLEEFLLDPCCMDCPASDCINERRMAEEIVRLREEIDRLRKGKEIVTSMLFDQTPLLNRMQDTLDLLREPSEKVLLAAVEAVSYGASYAALMHCIPAAVAAAEREASA